MNKADLLVLWEYNHWANERVLRAATQVTPEQFVAAANLSHSSLRGTLVHLVGVEQLWRKRCQEGISSATLLAEVDVPAISDLITVWSTEPQAMQVFIERLPDGEVQQMVTYTTTKGVAQTNRLWHLLLHIMNHSMQFRSEASILLSAYQHSPGDLDMLVFLREQQ